MKKILAVFLVLICMVSLTFCTKEEISTPGIDEVEIDEVGEELEDWSEDENTICFDATLYFPDPQALYLHPSEYTFAIDETTHVKEIEVLNALFQGPGFDELAPSLEGEDLINSVSVDENGLCTIDFKKDFVLLNTGGTAREAFALGSIVNSLCSLEHISSVKINIDGDTAHDFGHTTLDAVLLPQDDLIEH